MDQLAENNRSLWMCACRAPRCVIRPAMLYSLETTALVRAQEKRLDAADRRILRHKTGVSRKEKTRDHNSRQALGIEEKFSDEIRERRPRWFGQSSENTAKIYIKAQESHHFNGSRAFRS